MSSLGHIDDDELTVYVSEKSDPERSARIQSHVQFCEECKCRLVACFLARIAELKRKEEGSNCDERRAEKRLEGGEHGYMQTLFPLSFERAAVQIVDASTCGFGLVVNSQVATGTIVQVCTGMMLALGEVRSCKTADYRTFRLGIRVLKNRDDD